MEREARLGDHCEVRIVVVVRRMMVRRLREREVVSRSVWRRGKSWGWGGGGMICEVGEGSRLIEVVEVVVVRDDGVVVVVGDADIGAGCFMARCGIRYSWTGGLSKNFAIRGEHKNDWTEM